MAIPPAATTTTVEARNIADQPCEEPYQCHAGEHASDGRGAEAALEEIQRDEGSSVPSATPTSTNAHLMPLMSGCMRDA